MNLTGKEKEVVLALAENDMNIKATAETLYRHRNTIEYHISKIQKRTGLNAKCFYDLILLADMAKED